MQEDNDSVLVKNIVEDLKIKNVKMVNFIKVVQKNQSKVFIKVDKDKKILVVQVDKDSKEEIFQVLNVEHIFQLNFVNLRIEDYSKGIEIIEKIPLQVNLEMDGSMNIKQVNFKNFVVINYR